MTEPTTSTAADTSTDTTTDSADVSPPQRNSVVEFLRRVPFTASMVLLVLVLGLVTTALWKPLNEMSLWNDLAYGLPALDGGRWWTPVTGALFATVPAQYLPVIAIFAAGVGVCEWRLGTKIAAFAAIVGQLFGVLAAALLLSFVSRGSWTWANDLARDLDVGWSAGAMCAIVVVAFSFPAPWRGRTLVIVFSYCLINLLYVGVLWDIEHLSAALLGLVIGWRVRPPKVSIGQLSHHEARVVASTLFVIIAISDLVASLYPSNGPLGAVRVEVHGVIVAVDIIVMLLIAIGLHHGRRLAWWLAVALCVVSLLGIIVTPYSPRIITEVLIMGPTLLLLIRYRSAFDTQVARIGKRRLILDLVTIVVASAGYVIIGFTVMDSFRPQPTVQQIIDETIARLFLTSTDEFVGTTRPARLFLDSLSFIPLTIGITFLLVLLVRSIRPRSDRGRDDLIALLRTHGGTNLSWMATWDGNQYFATADGQAVVAYRVHAGTAIVLGDPIGAPDSVGRALIEFNTFCERQSWVPCVFSCTGAMLPQSDALGWSRLQVAEDTVIDLPGLEFKGKSYQDIRTALNKAVKSGVSFTMGRLQDQRFLVVQQARGISEQWVSDKGMPEMGFTLGGIDEALDPEVMVGLAIDDQGVLHGVTSWLPVYAAGGEVAGWTLDVMRRRPDGEFRPVVEFMIASSCLAFQEMGAQTASLSGAPLARSDPNEQLTGVDNLLNMLGQMLEPLYGFRSLHQFKTKFKPRYEPMYMLYPDDTALPRIGVALTRAYLPDAGVRDFATMLVSN